MKYAFEKRIGTHRILNTDHPVVAVAYGSGRKWVSALICNGLATCDAVHRTRREAIERAEGLSQPERFEIGTVEGGNFVADSISRDPMLTGFPTLEEALDEMRAVIALAREMWGHPLTNGAVLDRETNQIVWRQE